MNKYNIYDTSGKLLHHNKTARELSQKLNVSVHKIGQAASTGYVLNGEYRIKTFEALVINEHVCVYDTIMKRYTMIDADRNKVTERFGMDSRNISIYIRLHSMVEKRYFFFAYKNGAIEIPEWFKEWDEIAKTINAKLKKVNRERLVIK